MYADVLSPQNQEHVIARGLQVFVPTLFCEGLSLNIAMIKTLLLSLTGAMVLSDVRSALIFHADSSHEQGIGQQKVAVKQANIAERSCGTEVPSAYLLNVHRSLHAGGIVTRASPKSTKFTIGVHFHVISASQEANIVQPWMVANQFGVLQQAYASSNISFNLLGTDYLVNDTWATGQSDAEMKSMLRKGNYSTLNLYFQTNLSTTAYGIRTQLLGYCTLPTNVTYMPCSGCPVAEYPAVDYALDGCNVLAGTMPGGSVKGYNSGKTAVHETGHWFGLLHTFQGTTCGREDPGDFIDDTPQESVSTVGCPEGKDSCPECPGLDPIHNFMDYSTDACYESFTPTQIQRMQGLYGSLRLGR